MDKKVIFLKDTDTGPQDKTKDLYTLFLNLVRECNLSETVQVVRVADIGVYNKGVIVKILPDNVSYCQVKEADVKRIIDAMREGRVLEDLVCRERSKQVRIVLRNCGIIDPDSIEDYIACDGYQALKKALFEYGPEKVIEEMKKSGLARKRRRRLSHRG